MSDNYTGGSDQRLYRSTRRAILKAGATSAVAAGASSGSVGAQSDTTRQSDEQNAGDSHWERTQDLDKQAPEHAIEGYTSQASTKPGEIVDIHVSTDPVEEYRIAVHRIGWYNGDGGRRMTTIPGPDSSTEGIRQPIPEADPDTGYNEASWEVTDTLDIPNN